MLYLSLEQDQTLHNSNVTFQDENIFAISTATVFIRKCPHPSDSNNINM